MNYNARTQTDIPSIFRPISNLFSLFRPRPQARIHAADFCYEAAQIAWERVQDVNPLEAELDAIWAYHFPDVAGASSRVPSVVSSAHIDEEIAKTPSTGRLGDVESALDTPASSRFLTPPAFEHPATPPPPSTPVIQSRKHLSRPTPRGTKLRSVAKVTKRPAAKARQRRHKKLGFEDSSYKDVPSTPTSPAPSPSLSRQPRRLPKAERAMNATYKDSVEVDEDDLVVSTSSASKKRKRVVDTTFRPLPAGEESEEERKSSNSPKPSRRAIRRSEVGK